MNQDIQKKIIEHLNGLNEIERKNGSDALIEELAERYDVSEEQVQKIIADWQAGDKI